MNGAPSSGLALSTQIWPLSWLLSTFSGARKANRKTKSWRTVLNVCAGMWYRFMVDTRRNSSFWGNSMDCNEMMVSAKWRKNMLPVKFLCQWKCKHEKVAPTCIENIADQGKQGKVLLPTVTFSQKRFKNLLQVFVVFCWSSLVFWLQLLSFSWVWLL